MDPLYILVTGGNRGIGLEICRQLSSLGHHVFLGTRSVEKGEAARPTIPGNVDIIQLDVSDPASVRHAVKTFLAKGNHLDALINNAGQIDQLGALQADIQAVKSLMEVNFYGAWRCAQAFLPLLRKSEHGRIINISSGMGSFSELRQGGYAGYRLSKAGLNALTLLLATELQGDGISVNAMCPGWVQTDMGGSSAPRTVQQGADTAVWLATIKNSPSGCFFRNREEIPW